MKQINKSEFGRRGFLRATAVVAVAGSAVGCGVSKSPWRFFTAREGETLQAICDHIIPADQDPGARQAGVVRYIDRQLTGKFREHQQAYRDGLAAIDQQAGGNFADAPPERQLELLQRLDADRDKRQFFSLVVTHSMQGFYGSPRHGGNRDYVSWAMLGVPASPVRGRDHYDLTKGGRS